MEKDEEELVAAEIWSKEIKRTTYVSNYLLMFKL